MKRKPVPPTPSAWDYLVSLVRSSKILIFRDLLRITGENATVTWRKENDWRAEFEGGQVLELWKNRRIAWAWNVAGFVFIPVFLFRYVLSKLSAAAQVVKESGVFRL